jgi:hypothetical protein
VKSHTDARFWKFYDKLPIECQQGADKSFHLWRSDPQHPSLQFKRVDSRDPIYSVRIARGYRALGWLEGDIVTWFWIGSHDDYTRLLK